MTYAALLLLGFLATAMAVPTTIDGNKTFSRITVHLAYLSYLAVTKVRSVQECINRKCAYLFDPHMIAIYNDCVDECKNQSGKTEEPVEKINSERQVRDVKECEAKCSIYGLTPSTFQCMDDCRHQGKSLEAPLKTISAPTVTLRQSRDHSEYCKERCSSLYGSSGSDFKFCFNECRIGGQRLL